MNFFYFHCNFQPH